MQDKFKPLIKYLKGATVFGSTSLFIYYHISNTRKSIFKIVNPKVLVKEQHQPEYIYIDDPTYSLTLKLEQDKESKQAVGLTRIWKSLKHSLQWKLLWLCRHGNKEQRNIALEQLAAFKKNKIWDCCKLAQAMDQNTAVLLARTHGADLRYFLPPPIHIRRAALSSELLSFKFRDLIVGVQNINPHHCIHHLIHKYFVNVQEDTNLEVDSIPSKPDSISERELCLLCLEALYHHLTLFHVGNYKDDLSMKKLVDKGLIPTLVQGMLRYRNDSEFDIAILKVLTLLSIHTNLLKDFFQNGLIRELSRLLKSNDIRLSSPAAVCLANLSGEYCYKPGLFLLHPIYRTTKPPDCDTILVHGLRGGVFVTWRQRDKKCKEPIGIIEVTMSNADIVDNVQTSKVTPNYIDPELQQVMEEMIENDDEALLMDYDVVLHDVPIDAERAPRTTQAYMALKKRLALIEEDQDKCSYTYCWPKDWLPKDCNNLRILGINYWSSLSEWLEKCPAQSVDIPTRAADLISMCVEAGVGAKNTAIVWLAHSMGGLIVKHALVNASRKPEQEITQLSENTKAVLFFGTPHRGSSLATIPRAAAAVIWPSTDVRQLQENSSVLLELNEDFIKTAVQRQWETISFGEMKPTLVTAFKVPVHFVESYSADLGHGVFYQLPLDHLSLCKPATRQSVLYTTVLDVLKRATTHEEEMHHMFLYRLLSLLYGTLNSKIMELFEIIDKLWTNKSSNSDSGLR